MNACLTFDSFGYSQAPSPARCRPAMSAQPSTRAPAQEQRNIRLYEIFESVVDALENDSGTSRMTTGYAEIMKFAMLLPSDVPVVESYITPSGSLCFDWDHDPSNQLSIMLQAGGRIAYAAYFDGDRVNGSSRFSGKLPDDLAHAVRRWQSRASGSWAR